MERLHPMPENAVRPTRIIPVYNNNTRKHMALPRKVVTGSCFKIQEDTVTPVLDIVKDRDIGMKEYHMMVYHLCLIFQYSALHRCDKWIIISRDVSTCFYETGAVAR